MAHGVTRTALPSLTRADATSRICTGSVPASSEVINVLPTTRGESHADHHRVFCNYAHWFCSDSKPTCRYKQVVKYYPGIAAHDEILFFDRIREGAFGGECLSQIREVYRDCCRLKGKEDEVWLYGFSRGAYVVRAVAGLLHYIRALDSADGPDAVFQRDYKDALKIYRNMQKSDQLGAGQVRIWHPWAFIHL